MAQLVARLVRNEKVGGSNPPSSTTGRHPIADVGFLYAWRGVAVPVVVLLVAPHVLSCGPGCWLCPWAAARPRAVRAASFARRRELRSARRLEARPGPATAHGHRSQALRSLRRPPHQWGLLCWRVAGRVVSQPNCGCRSATSHVIPLRLIQTLNLHRWNCNVLGRLEK